jgi:CPA2 family monovalent cation:H+ antiporter-2
MNQGLIHKAREMEAPVVLGDATRAIILEHAGIEKARAIVIAVNTQEDTRRIVSQARRLNPDIYIAVRTYFVRDLKELAAQGVNMVVPADFEASVKIFSHVLEEFDVPRNILASQIAAVRAGDYGVFRGESSSSNESLQDLLKVLQLTSTQTFYLAENSTACGKTIAHLELRKVTGATVIAVVRDREPNTNPGPEYELQASDVLVLVGAHEQLRAAGKLLGASTHLGSSRADPEKKDG